MSRPALKPGAEWDATVPMGAVRQRTVTVCSLFHLRMRKWSTSVLSQKSEMESVPFWVPSKVSGSLADVTVNTPLLS